MQLQPSERVRYGTLEFKALLREGSWSLFGDSFALLQALQLSAGKRVHTCEIKKLCGVVWCGVVWCGGVLCGVVWCGGVVVWCAVCVVLCGVVWCCVVRCSVVYV